MECKLSRIITHWSIPSILLKDQKRLTISITQPGQCQTSKDCQKLMRRNNRIIMIHPYIYIQIQSSIRFSSNRIQTDGITSKRWTAGPCFEESPKPPCSYAKKTSKNQSWAKSQTGVQYLEESGRTLTSLTTSSRFQVISILPPLSGLQLPPHQEPAGR